jgi:lipopolysaccharide export system protein LptA
MLGGVILTQNDNVLRGERLVVDMTTGVSRVEGGRVQGIFKNAKDAAKSSSGAAPKETKPSGPFSIGGGR